LEKISTTSPKYDFPELTREELLKRFGKLNTELSPEIEPYSVTEEPTKNEEKVTFLKTYTLPNIINEIKGRLKIN
jgi:hypothetical protein